MLAKMKPARPSLEERIQQVRQECEALLDQRAAELHREFSNIPEPALRMQVTRGCPCQSAIRLLQEGSQ